MTLRKSPRIKITQPTRKIKPPTDEELNVLGHCMDDVIYWFENHCYTQDQHRQDLRARPFPKYSEQPYLYKIIEYLHTDTPIAIAKSRQMMISWVCVAYALWATQFHRNVWTFFVSLKRSHSINLVKRGKFIYRHQKIRPVVMELIHTVQHVRGDIGTSNTFPFFSPRDEYMRGAHDEMSKIVGLSQNPDEIRMETATYVFYDEDAFQDTSGASHRAIMPAIGDIGSIVDVSTPNGQNHFFMKVHDMVEEQEMF